MRRRCSSRRHAIEPGEREKRFAIRDSEILIEAAINAAHAEFPGFRPFICNARLERAVSAATDQDGCSPVLLSDKIIVLEEEQHLIGVGVGQHGQ